MKNGNISKLITLIIIYCAYLLLLIIFFPIAIIYTMILCAIALTILYLGIIINKSSYEKKLESKVEYSRDIPSIRPLIAGCIEGRRKPRIDDVIATILDLVNRKYLSLIVTGNKYFISLNKDKNFDELLSYEQAILKLIFDTRNNNTQIDLYDAIRSIRSSFEKRQVIKIIYGFAQDDSITPYYTNFGDKYGIGMGAIILSDFITIFSYIILGNLITSHLPFNLSGDAITTITMISFVYIFTISSIICMQALLKDEYVEIRKNLKNFKHYLIDFSRFKEDKIEEVKLYDEYFIYALAFGVADKAEKELKQASIDSTIADIFHTLQENDFFELKK